LSIVLNQPDIEIGQGLQDFKDFTIQFPSELRGEALSNSGISSYPEDFTDYRSHSWNA